MEIGIAVSAPGRSLADLAKRAEDNGLGSIWSVETQHEGLVAAAIMAGATSFISVGTGVALAFPRSPTIMAMAAEDLNQYSEGRMILGLGTQVKRVIQDRFSVEFSHPAPRIAEYGDAIRTVWAASRGEKVTHEGRFYRVTMPTFHGAGDLKFKPPPIHIAAFNRRMLNLAAKSFDGVYAHPLVSPSFIKEVMLPETQREDDTSNKRFSYSQGVLCQVAKDGEQAKREARIQVAFYGTTRTYRTVFEHLGYPDLTDQLRTVWGEPDLPSALERLMPPEVADAIAVAGTADEVRETLSSRYSGLVDRVILNGGWFGLSQERILENYADLMDAVSGQSSPPLGY